MNKLDNEYIDDTFDGLLHVNGDPIPPTGRGVVYDGSGQASALSVGLSGNGIGVDGSLTVGSLTYPSTNGTVGSFLYQKTATEIDRIDKIPAGSLEDVVAKTTDTRYTRPLQVNVNEQGLVTKIVEGAERSDFTLGSLTYLKTSGAILLTGSGYESGIRNIGSGANVRYNLNSLIDDDANPKFAICYISVNAKFSVDREQYTNFYAVKANMGDSYMGSPILTVVGGANNRLGGGATFLVPVYTNPNNEVQFEIYCDNHVDTDSTTNNKWPIKVYFIGYIE